MIHVSPESGLVTIAGGKWTTYRAMAEETITAAVENCNLEPTSESKTDGLLLGNQINQKLPVISLIDRSFPFSTVNSFQRVHIPGRQQCI